jgi:hypothetical protein
MFAIRDVINSASKIQPHLFILFIPLGFSFVVLKIKPAREIKNVIKYHYCPIKKLKGSGRSFPFTTFELPTPKSMLQNNTFSGQPVFSHNWLNK